MSARPPPKFLWLPLDTCRPTVYSQGMEATKEHTMTTTEYTIPAERASDAPYVDDIMRQARSDADDGNTVTVIYWDDHSDPQNPGWVRRTYTRDEDGTVDYTEDML